MLMQMDSFLVDLKIGSLSTIWCRCVCMIELMTCIHHTCIEQHTYVKSESQTYVRRTACVCRITAILVGADSGSPPWKEHSCTACEVFQGNQSICQRSVTRSSGCGMILYHSLMKVKILIGWGGIRLLGTFFASVISELY